MEVRVLGPVEVVVHGRPVRLAKRQHRLIMGILSIQANRAVPSARLVELLWGDRAPARPRAVLHSRLSELRAVLRTAGGVTVQQAIVTGDDGYTLRIPNRMVDAHLFEALVAESRTMNSDMQLRDKLRQALRLWRGSILGGWSSTGPTDALLRSLESARLTAAEDLYEAELRLGNHTSITDEITALSAAHPTRDRLTAAAMLALHRAGRSAEAIGVYHQRRVWLASELGVDPAPALRHLHVAVLRHDPALNRQPPLPGSERPTPT
ncbi:DNA-binding transcriptional activator of the SARP family [Micromonospora nigra]|uniref:DNA-binding transcriptional activator of the SARP family n=1 Tax=Micromonospora nigra TaxID=145857 RepID=A0A1C6RCA4_9ACTN|nr:BTAD domain-containing putative transcriptional regulator [Micromonospora nigra]SCL14786.1 DNA-binding transcriptional activator of the SARP family [Micromonospora nigra]